MAVSKIHPTSFKVILRKSENVLSFAALACTQAVSGEHFGGDQKKVNKIKTFVIVIRGPKLSFM